MKYKKIKGPPSSADVIINAQNIFVAIIIKTIQLRSVLYN